MFWELSIYLRHFKIHTIQEKLKVVFLGKFVLIEYLPLHTNPYVRDEQLVNNQKVDYKGVLILSDFFRMGK